eukprot:scaffold40013_cov59-Attheya_sp.AAC.1
MRDSAKGMMVPFQFHELSSASLVHCTPGFFVIPRSVGAGSIDALTSETRAGGGHTHSSTSKDEENDTQQELIVVETKGRVTTSIASKEWKEARCCLRSCKNGSWHSGMAHHG